MKRLAPATAEVDHGAAFTARYALFAGFAGLAWLGCLACLNGCDLMSTRVSDGGGSEATNGTITCAAVYADGAQAAWSSVILRREDYLRDTAKAEHEVIPDALADANGIFRLDSIAPGAYTMEIHDGRGNAAVTHVVKIAKKILALPPDTLHPVGTVTGILGSVPGLPLPGYVQIYGLEQSVRADSTGRFRFATLPMGRFRLHPVAAKSGWFYADISVSLVSPQDTLELGIVPLQNFAEEDYSQWSRSRNLTVDIAALGPNDTLTDFPLPVRLDSTNFDFASVAPTSVGADLRFSGPGGRHLAYEVEEFDPADKRGALWVKLDTLIGGGSNPVLTLHWGKPGAPDYSEGKRVFNGNSGAWHMRPQAPINGLRTFPDASIWAINGTGDALPAGISAIGPGASFTGGQHVSLPNHPMLHPVHGMTYSAWFRAIGSDTAGGELGSNGDNFGVRLRQDGSLYFFAFADTLWTPGTAIKGDPFASCATKGVNLIDSAWHLATAVYDGAYLRLYLDGAEAAKTPYAARGLLYPFQKGFEIGRHGFATHDKDFQGRLDEVRFSGHAWSPGRIKAEYEFQKPGSLRVRFE